MTVRALLVHSSVKSAAREREGSACSLCTCTVGARNFQPIRLIYVPDFYFNIIFILPFQFDRYSVYRQFEYSLVALEQKRYRTTPKRGATYNTHPADEPSSSDCRSERSFKKEPVEFKVILFLRAVATPRQNPRREYDNSDAAAEEEAAATVEALLLSSRVYTGR